MELKDTVNLMCSDNYRERFKGELLQLKIRVDKLQTVIEKYYNQHLEFTPSCPIELLEMQLEYMEKYLDILKIRDKLDIQ